MSNPGVLSLASMDAIPGFNYRFEIEDNIGEAIHVHYKDIRLDLTVQEFYALADIMGPIIDKIVDVEGFSYKDYDPVNLVGLAGKLPYLEKVTVEEVYLEELLIDTYDDHGNEVIRPLNESRVVKALRGLTAENDMRKQVNYYNPHTAQRQTNMERVLYNLERIKDKNYEIDKDYILLFNNENRIYDGQHRASCLYYLYGNIKVKARRLWFRDQTDAESYDNGESTEREIPLEPGASEIEVAKGKYKKVCINLSTLPINLEDYKIIVRKK